MPAELAVLTRPRGHHVVELVGELADLRRAARDQGFGRHLGGGVADSAGQPRQRHGDATVERGKQQRQQDESTEAEPAFAPQSGPRRSCCAFIQLGSEDAPVGAGHRPTHLQPPGRASPVHIRRVADLRSRQDLTAAARGNGEDEVLGACIRRGNAFGQWLEWQDHRRDDPRAAGTTGGGNENGDC